jgi:RNA recognition motif-containing protein
MNIYVGNLAFALTEDDLRQAFENYGTVASVTIITDKFTGKPRGFAFVEMPDNSEAQAAIDGLNGQDLGGRALRVNEAKPRESRPRNGGGGRGGFGGGPRGGGRGRF